MLKKIESIRKKPKEVRNRYAFWVALGCTALVSVFWLTGISSRFETVSKGAADDIEVQGGISRSISDMKASVSEGVEALNVFKSGIDKVDADTQEVKDDAQEIDFDTFFIETESLPDEIEVPERQNHVLIGTTSGKKNTSTEGEFMIQ